jgi:hypothetical protein
MWYDLARPIEALVIGEGDFWVLRSASQWKELQGVFAKRVLSCPLLLVFWAGLAPHLNKEAAY